MVIHIVAQVLLSMHVAGAQRRDGVTSAPRTSTGIHDYLMGTSTVPTHSMHRQSDRKSKDSATPVSLAEAVGAYEKQLLEEALKKTRGNRVQAAKLLDSTERIVSYKVRKYHIDCRQFR